MGHKIHHREVGDGPVLILLHGYAGSVLHWDAIVQNLKSQYRLVIPNISHLYWSQDKIFFTVQVETLARYIREHFPNQKVNIAGNSYGGALAWALHLLYPELFDRVVLINPMVPDPARNFLPPEIRYFCVLPLSQPTLTKMLGTPIGKAFLKRMAGAFRSERTQGPGRVENLTGKKILFVAHLIHRFIWILGNEDWSYWKNRMLRVKEHRGISGSICLIYDRDDYLFSPKTYQNFAREIGCSCVKEIGGGGHLAIKSRPDTVSKLIAEFVAQEEAA